MEVATSVLFCGAANQGQACCLVLELSATLATDSITCIPSLEMQCQPICTFARSLIKPDVSLIPVWLLQESIAAASKRKNAQAERDLQAGLQR